MRNKDGRKNKNSLLQDVLVVLICLIGSLFFFYLFYNDINATLLRQDEHPVGIITFRYNTAQRRFIDRVVWDRLKNESPIYNGDVIRTADLSEAVITFEYGDILDLYSNTILQVFVDDDGSRINLADGGVSVNAARGGVRDARSFVISSGDSLVTVESGAVMRASSGSDGGLDIAVSEGNVFLQFINAAAGLNTPLSVGAGSGVQLSASGQTRASAQAVAVAPVPGAKFLTRDSQGASVDFNWNTINYSNRADEAEGTVTRLEIARDRSFSRIHFAQNFSGNNFNIVLPAGDWFWRLYPLETPQQAGTNRNIPYSRLSVVFSAPPSAVSPAEGQVINYVSGFPQVRFRWTASSQAQSYLLEAADNPSMNNPALSVQVRGTGNIISYNTSSLGRGAWYWRVTPVYGREFAPSAQAADLQNASSAISSFTIERNVNLSSPVLIAPAAGAVLNIERGMRDILFTWRREAEAASYTIRISSDRNMSNPVIEQSTSDTFYRYESDATSLTPGTWYWTVSQTNGEGSVSPASGARSFNAMLGEIEQRAVFPPDTYTIADSLLPFTRFTWKTNLSGTRFQVSDSERFTTLLIDENANNESYTIRSLRHGVYYWRITGIAGNQRIESAVRRVAIVPSLPAPSLIRPESIAATRDGSVVIMEGQPVELRWHPSEGAEYYTFRLSKGNQTVNESIVYGAAQTVNMQVYGDGLYEWEVQGHKRETPLSTRRPGLTASMRLNIIYLKPVALVNPNNGREYSGVNASRNPDIMQWTSPVPPAAAELVIARDAQMTNVVFRRAEPPQSLVMPRLSAGDYYWTVRARTVEGLDISAVSPSRFRVLPIPPLPAPANRRPANRHAVTIPMFMESRSLEFTWNSVQGANGYILSVFRGTGAERRTVLETNVLTETNYTIQDLRVIGRGNFFWQVEAVFVIDGFIEQRGILQENSLVMDIPIPEQIETIDTGVLYGN